MPEEEPSHKKRKIGVRLSNAIFDKVSELAEKDSMNLSEWIREVIRNRIAQIENPKLLGVLNPYNDYKRDLLEIKEGVQNLFGLKEEFHRIEYLISNLRAEFPSTLENDKNLEEHRELIVNIIRRHKDREEKSRSPQRISTESIINESKLERDLVFDILTNSKETFEYDIRKKGWDLII